MTLMAILPTIVTLIACYLLIKSPISISIPTDRGMHKNNIASSGGIALMIGLSFIFVSVPLTCLILIGVLGFLDDKYSLTKYLRFGMQIGISAYIVNYHCLLDGDDISLIYLFILVVISTYTINIYNFMDGIDQLAISQAAFFIFSWALIFDDLILNINILFLLTAFFLVNYPKTKLFLGNSGSYLLGMLIIIISLYTICSTDVMSSIPLFILMSSFYADTTYTLIARFIRNLNKKDSTIMESIRYITNAHRTHLYQKITIKENSHSKTVFMIMSYNVIWCLPLCYLSFKYMDYSLLFLFLSYSPYIYYCYINKAGVES